MKNNKTIEADIRAILFKFWDPIDINYNPNLSGEYDIYIGSLKKMIINNSSLDDFIFFLKNIELNDMGFETTDEKALKNVSVMLKNLCSIYGFD